MYLELDDKEHRTVEAFKTAHKKCEEKNLGAIGGHFSFNLLQTGVGMFGSITCNVCKKSENFTDYDLI